MSFYSCSVTQYSLTMPRFTFLGVWWTCIGVCESLQSEAFSVIREYIPTEGNALNCTNHLSCSVEADNKVLWKCASMFPNKLDK